MMLRVLDLKGVEGDMLVRLIARERHDHVNQEPNAIEVASLDEAKRSRFAVGQL